MHCLLFDESYILLLPFPLFDTAFSMEAARGFLTASGLVVNINGFKTDYVKHEMCSKPNHENVQELKIR